MYLCIIILCVGAFVFFFFSSRRRHTRCSRDWSSDVCSSDLGQPQDEPPAVEAQPDVNAPSGEAPAQIDQGVARISMIHGDVSTQRGDSGDWSAATVNAPVVSGDKVSTADNARAEL